MIQCRQARGQSDRKSIAFSLPLQTDRWWEEGYLLLNALWKGPQRRAFCPLFFFFFFDAQEHLDSGGCTLEALSLFIPSVSTCTSSQKVLCLIETSLEPSGYLVALKCFQRTENCRFTIGKWTKWPKGKAESDQMW